MEVENLSLQLQIRVQAMINVESSCRQSLKIFQIFLLANIQDILDIWVGRYGRYGGGKFEPAVADQSPGNDKCGELMLARVPDILDIDNDKGR